MRKIFYMVLAILSVCFVASCGGSDEPADTLKTITGVTFEDKTYNYNGNEIEIIITGSVPSEVSVSYACNKGTNAGVYQATATLTGEGYKTLILNAKLTINKLDYTGITFTGSKVDYDGVEKTIVVSGELPAGTTVTYQNNKGTNANKYEASAKLSNPNYNDLTLYADLEIEKLDYTGITFTGSKVDYDGVEKTIVVSGELPAGTTVTYQNNKGTNAGKYEASAKLSNPNYNDLTLYADLEIEKIAITGVTFSDETVTHDGTEKAIVVSGTLPNGVVVEYENNKGTGVGTYNATAVLKGSNYITLELTATLKIKTDLSKMATTILTSLSDMPDAWSFLPESFALENRVYSGGKIDFNSNFVYVSSLSQLGVGKQLNVLYDTLLDAEGALSYLSIFYGSISTIVEFYQTYITNNPDDYFVFEKNMGDFKVKITLLDDTYQILISYSGASIELLYDSTTETTYGRIELSSSNVVKYVSSENYLKLSVSILNVSIKQIEFVREGEITVGYVYEYLGVKSLSTKTSAMIQIDGNYTSIISNKKESTDMSTEYCVEIYNNETGKLIGYEVKETISKITYNTMFFNLWNIAGISSVKKSDITNGSNLDTIYVNGSSNSFVAKKVGGLSLKTASRRYDIEMKTTYYYTYDEATGKYSKISMEIPMMFVQSEQLETFAADVLSANASNGITAETTILLTTSALNYIEKQYTLLSELFVEVKELVTYDYLIESLGERNPYFDKVEE